MATNVIALWKPELSPSSSPANNNNNSTINSSTDGGGTCKDKFLHLCDFDCVECNVWYVRFGTNSNCTMLAIGNGIGDLRLFHIDSRRYFHLVNLYCSAL